MILALGSRTECPGARLVNLEQFGSARRVHALREGQRDGCGISADDMCVRNDGQERHSEEHS